MVWAQFFPFVALMLFDGDDNVKGAISRTLFGSFSVWVALNVVFLMTINQKYIQTFFTRKTGPQYTSELFIRSTADSAKFNIAFKNRLSYTTDVHPEIKEWIANNIHRWRASKRAGSRLKKVSERSEWTYGANKRANERSKEDSDFFACFLRSTNGIATFNSFFLFFFSRLRARCSPRRLLAA